MVYLLEGLSIYKFYLILSIVLIFDCLSQDLQWKGTRGKYPVLQVWRQYSIDNYYSNNKDNLKHLLFQFGFENNEIDKLIHNNNCIVKLDPYEFVLPKLLFYMYTLNNFIKTIPRSSIEELCNRSYFFSYSLEKLIVPRFAFIKHVRYNCSISAFFDLLQLSDNDFGHFIGGNFANQYSEYRSKIWRGGRNAVDRDDFEMLKILLDCGWNPNSEIDRNGRTVLMRACALGNSTNSFNIVKLLLSSRSFDGLFQTRLTLTSKFEERSLFGDGCLHWAATGGSLEIFTYLCSLGCNPFDLDNDLSSPLHWAAGSGSSAILNYLITTLEDDVNKVNVFGCTPAHFASSGGQLTILKFLLVHGCDLLKQNYHGHDALTKAVAFNRNNIVDWLVKEVPGVKETINKLRPWNIDTKSNNTINMSLFQIAAIVGNHEVINILKSHEN